MVLQEDGEARWPVRPLAQRSALELERSLVVSLAASPEAGPASGLVVS